MFFADVIPVTVLHTNKEHREGSVADIKIWYILSAH